MEWNEALPLLRENHTGVAVTITAKGRAQSTVVSTAVLDYLGSGLGSCAGLSGVRSWILYFTYHSQLSP